MILALILIPLIAGTAEFFLKIPFLSRTILIISALAHFVLVVLCWMVSPLPAFNGWLSLDSPGLLFLSISSALFLLASVYRVGLLRTESNKVDFEEEFIFTSTPEAVFCGCMLVFLSTMTLVCVSQQSGVTWIAIEATTLASAPLVYFHKHRRSLEAAWKYLLICSVGIALALLGNFFLAVSASGSGNEIQLVYSSLQIKAGAGLLNLMWLKAAFMLLLVGYGTKMGLAPMHTWLPDAHSEAPSSVSALLSGALLNCSFLGILRAQQILSAANQAKFGGDLLIGFGLFSMAVAGVFIIKQKDYKRLLAYSSVEHMGILSLGVGLGSGAVYGAMFHAVGHSFTKAMLFLTAGNILTAYRTKNVSRISGLFRALPVTGILWIMGFFAVTGSPPFSTFLSEFTILRSAIEQGRGTVAFAYLFFLVLVFAGMIGTFFRMAQGEPSPDFALKGKGETILSVLPPIVMALVVLILGFTIPAWFNRVLVDAAFVLGGGK